jgi:isopentenyl diphosphate isomerase/L-lactate dehydrogenase-like FMN-dependent dehydrogenase
VVKAIALGASAVGIGRLAAFGLAADGADGVRRVCELLKAEMETVVGRIGADRVEKIGRDCLMPIPA